MEDQVGTQLRDVKLKVFLGENRRLALAVNDTHQLCVDVTVLTQKQGHQNEKGVHDDRKTLVGMQSFDISRDHPLKSRFTIFRSQQRKIEVLREGGSTWQQWTHLQQKTFAIQPAYHLIYHSACAAGR